MPMCKRLGASGVVKLNKQTIQVIVGAKAESIGDEMKKVVTRGPVAAAAAAPAGNVATAAPAAKPQAVAEREDRCSRWFRRLPVTWWPSSRCRTKPSPAKPLATAIAVKPTRQHRGGPGRRYRGENFQHQPRVLPRNRTTARKSSSTWVSTPWRWKARASNVWLKRART